MKVCSPQLGLSQNSILGGEVHDFNLLDHLSKKDVTWEILLPKNRFTIKNKKFRIYHLFFKTVFPPHLFNLYALPFIFLNYKSKKFDILRIHSPYYLGIAALIFKLFYPKVPIVTTIHLKEKRFDMNFILKRTIQIYDHIFTVSNYLKDWISTEFQIDPKKISVIYNGVEQNIQPESKDKNLVKKFNLEKKIVLLNLGLFNTRKNVLFLIKVYKELLLDEKNLTLFFCGSGPLKNEMIKLVKKFKLHGKIFILNPVFGENKKKILNLADIFLFPSLNEGFGLVGAEAMACAKPIIASDNTSLPEIVNDKTTGFLAKNNDINDWKNKILILIKDVKLRRKFGKKGRKIQLIQFNWDQVAQKTLKIYKDLLGLN